MRGVRDVRGERWRKWTEEEKVDSELRLKG